MSLSISLFLLLKNAVMRLLNLILKTNSYFIFLIKIWLLFTVWTVLLVNSLRSKSGECKAGPQTHWLHLLGLYTAALMEF